MLLVLGLADALAGVIFLAKAFKVEVPSSMVLFFGAYLIIKGGIFVLNSMDWGSIGDVVAGTLLFISIFLVLPEMFLLIFGSILIIKGVLSLSV